MQTRCYIPIEPTPEYADRNRAVVGAAIIDFVMALGDGQVEQKAVVLLPDGSVTVYALPSHGWRVKPAPVVV